MKIKNNIVYYILLQIASQSFSKQSNEIITLYMEVHPMKKNLFIHNRALVALIFVTLLTLVLPVAAVSMTIDLDKTYKFKLANVSTLESTDLGNLSESKVSVLSTVGDNSDLQTIHTPSIRDVTRNFKTMSGTFRGVTVTITGENPSTAKFLQKPEFKIYTQRMVPTFRMTAPGQTGNPVVTKYNESWVKEDTGSLSSLFRASDGVYMYNDGGVLNINVTNNVYTSSGGTWVYDPANITKTLASNKVALDAFTSDAGSAFMMGDTWPEMKADTGKYYAGAIEHDEEAQTLSVYAMYPIVVLKAPTPMSWTNGSGTYTTAPFSYLNRKPSAVTLGFTGANPDLTRIARVTYFFINDSARYDMYMNIDTDKLAENAETRWQGSFTPGTEIIDLLYEGIKNDVGTPFNYTLTAVGNPTPAPSYNYSTIAITPGYGISGTTLGTSVRIPVTNISQLNPGRYDLYVMGTDSDNNIVALDQKLVYVEPRPYGNWVGVFRPSTHKFILKNGTARTVVAFGKSTDLPVSGDWNGDGLANIGVYRPSTQMFTLKNGSEKTKVAWGVSTDLPVTGDWNGDGLADVGVFRPSTHRFVLKNGSETTKIIWGLSTDLPVTGDWNGDGLGDVGVFRQSTQEFILKNGSATTIQKWGLTTDLAVTGDWSGDGLTDVGVFRQANNKFIVKNGSQREEYVWGKSGDLPVTGKWR
jgi:hypothetical protein